MLHTSYFICRSVHQPPPHVGVCVCAALDALRFFAAVAGLCRWREHLTSKANVKVNK